MIGFESPFPPAVSQVGHNTWELLHAMTYHDGDRTIVVPEKQQTDWASVPPPLRWALSPMTGTAAALLHDHLWRMRVPAGEMTYPEADRILREALGSLGVDRFTCWAMWAAVRWGALTRGPVGRRGWIRSAPAVLAISVPVAVLTVPAVLLLPSLAIIWVCKRIAGTRKPTDTT